MHIVHICCSLQDAFLCILQCCIALIHGVGEAFVGLITNFARLEKEFQLFQGSWFVFRQFLPIRFVFYRFVTSFFIIFGITVVGFVRFAIVVVPASGGILAEKVTFPIG